MQRAVTDFGADSSFAAAVEKVREHYGVEVSQSGARSVTQAHGAAMRLEPEVAVRLPRANGEWRSSWQGLRQAHA